MLLNKRFLFVLMAIIIGTLVLISIKYCIGAPAPQKKICSFPLDLAPNSVDDMYNGCEDEMGKRVASLLNTEKKGEFREAWRAAQKCYSNNWATTTSRLKKEQIMAIHAYTLGMPPIYDKFNKAVRTQKSGYKTKFQYHALHFYLTMALRSLKHNAPQCVKTYRRTNCKFETEINREIRFGGFTSSSEGGYPSPHFGDQSCFEITTCFGADISTFSMFEWENEVLIPPYEVFKVTDIQKRSGKNFLPCQVVYKLKSTRKTRSSLNCALTKSGL
ncbi:erythroblast NAD(P)(+)--arginine ADP-ribosyltransferase-like isoform X1 [Xiphophorus couchianus]|uniref:erythroblast NAD(P)(+)--arginine ADP-ribosyltransferase-like isoform X1 n=1 Tax=Xiphophorus couchianus TaxID=32473 RepID=UPI0010168E14|nr:erythroblast NAD(P)(+)--arginine ADP-ribosyltransferase-like isoform X1 [Xiphophorus couchianus]XP_027874879.1 erythroblast NAD(P)(+)--arginine ADP-ribosyltransferase-like isoform X1 [Xiphophorus couchianus]